MPPHKFAKFKWWVKKDRKSELANELLLHIFDALVLTAKKSKVSIPK